MNFWKTWTKIWSVHNHNQLWSFHDRLSFFNLESVVNLNLIDYVFVAFLSFSFF